MSSIPAHGSPVGEALGHREQVVAARVGHGGELVPGHRGRDRRSGPRPQGVRRGDGPVTTVLVEIDEDPLTALLLPPLGGDALVTLLELAAESDRRVPHVDEVPARLDPHVDVHAAVAAGLRVARQTVLLQQLPGDAGHADGVGERGAGLGVEVDAQLVGVVVVAAASRPRVEGDRAHLGAPPDRGQVGDAHLVGCPSAGEGHTRRLDVLRGALGNPLAVERVALVAATRREGDALVHPGRPALQSSGPVAEGAHDAGADGGVVLHHLELGHLGRGLGRGVDHAVRTGHPDRLSVGFDLGCW